MNIYSKTLNKNIKNRQHYQHHQTHRDAREQQIHQQMKTELDKVLIYIWHVIALKKTFVCLLSLILKKNLSLTWWLEINLYSARHTMKCYSMRTVVLYCDVSY